MESYTFPPRLGKRKTGKAGGFSKRTHGNGNPSQGSIARVIAGIDSSFGETIPDTGNVPPGTGGRKKNIPLHFKQLSFEPDLA
jgi:hypothetical protein